MSLLTPDRNGKWEDIILGYDTLENYVRDTAYHGAVIGRYANRIAGGNFSIDNGYYQLAVNNGKNHLHGGVKGFDKRVWHAEIYRTTAHVGVQLSYRSEHLEEGYPGNLHLVVNYILDHHDQLSVTYAATTDQPTIINFTHHPYFNLAGDGKRDVLDHVLQLNAAHYLPVDNHLIPTGAIMQVQDTPFDFQQPQTIGSNLFDIDEQLQTGNGYDHCWVLKEKDNEKLIAAGSIYEPLCGRFMQIFTTEPGIQVYTGNYLDNVIPGKNNVEHKPNYGLCMETQHFPDAPNHAVFPSALLVPGAQYHSKTVYKLSLK